MEHAFLLIFIVTGVSSCSIKVCLHWTVEGNTLKLTCRTDNLSLFVNFNDNHGQEIAHCTIPIPAPLCHDTNENTTTVQYPDQNVTIVKVNGIIDQRINGNWSCLHGVDDDVVEIYIKTSKDSCNDSKILKTELVIIAVGGFVILVVLYFFCIFRRKCKNTCGVNSTATGSINASINSSSGVNNVRSTPPSGASNHETTTSRGENNDETTTSREENNDEPTTSRGSSNDEPTTSRGENNAETTTSRGASNDETTTSIGGNNDEPATSKGGNNDEPTTPRGASNDEPTTSRGPSNGINNKDKLTNKDIQLKPLLKRPRTETAGDIHVSENESEEESF